MLECHHPVELTSTIPPLKGLCSIKFENEFHHALVEVIKPAKSNFFFTFDQADIRPISVSNKTAVEILVFGVYKIPLLLRKVHMIDRVMLIMFLDRRNSENS